MVIDYDIDMPQQLLDVFTSQLVHSHAHPLLPNAERGPDCR